MAAPVPAAATQAASRHVRLAWPAGATAALAAPAASALGLFAQFGLTVRLVDGHASGADLPGLLRSSADAAVCPVCLLLEPLRTGLDARLTTGVSGGGLRLLTEKRTGLRHIEDVRHKRIGVSDLHGAARLFFSIMMRRKGIDPFHDVNWVEIAPPAQEAALRGRQVDAVAAGDPQGFYLLRAVRAVEIATSLSGSYRERVSMVLACNDGFLRGHPSGAASLTRAIRQASAWAARDRAGAAALIAPWTPRLGPADRLAMVASETLGERPIGEALSDDVAEYADELRLLGTFPANLDSERFARGVCENLLA